MWQLDSRGARWTFAGGSLAIAATLPPLETRRDSMLVRFVNLRRELRATVV